MRIAPRKLVLRYWQKLERRDPELLYLFFEITRRCNLSCRHCGSDCSTGEQGRVLTAGSWLAIAAKISETFERRPFIVLTGGEPLTHPKLFEIGAGLSGLGFRWGMVSNARAWEAGLLDRLQKAGLSSLTISLDGPKEAHTNLRRDPASFDAVLTALRDCAAHAGPGLMYDVVTCVHPGNSSQLDQTAELLIEENVPNWRVFRIFPAGRSSGNGELNLSADETAKVLQWVADRKPILRQRGLNLNWSCEGWFPPEFETKIRGQSSFCRAHSAGRGWNHIRRPQQPPEIRTGKHPE